MSKGSSQREATIAAAAAAAEEEETSENFQALRVRYAFLCVYGET